MKPILIGSRALHYWNNDVPINESTDWDFISDDPIYGADYHPVIALNDHKLLQFVSPQTVETPFGEASVMGMLGLAIMKRSHLHRKDKFEKNILHYHRYGLKECLLRYSLVPSVQYVLEERIALTTAKYPTRTPNLNMTVGEFFDDAVTKIFDHDYLHELVAFGESPLYKKLQKDSTRAWCEKDLWDKLCYNDKVKCVSEEAYVIAIERFLLPDWKANPKISYYKAVGRICTTLTSGWFRDFAIENYPQIMDCFDLNKILGVKCILMEKTNDASKIPIDTTSTV